MILVCFFMSRAGGGCWGAGTPEVLAAAVLHGCHVGLFCLILTGDLGFVWQDENFEG